jgi:hypothetical protein
MLTGKECVPECETEESSGEGRILIGEEGCVLRGINKRHDASDFGKRS